MAIVMDGVVLSRKLKAELACAFKKMAQEIQRQPVLACVCAGEDEACCVYLKSQAEMAREVGLGYRKVSLPSSITSREFVEQIRRLNADASVDAIMVQSPLPAGISRDDVMALVDPAKDAEGLHPQNMGCLLLGQPRVVPCTAGAVMAILREYQIPLEGKDVVVIGHSATVGKPLAVLLMDCLSTTTVCHVATSRAGRLPAHVGRADILVVAVGKPSLIEGRWLKEGAVVIDVGINRVNGKITGDVEYAPALERAGYITPVPGGVGPVTVAMLAKNCLELVRRKQEQADRGRG